MIQPGNLHVGMHIITWPWHHYDLIRWKEILLINAIKCNSSNRDVLERINNNVLTVKGSLNFGTWIETSPYIHEGPLHPYDNTVTFPP